MLLLNILRIGLMPRCNRIFRVHKVQNVRNQSYALSVRNTKAFVQGHTSQQTFLRRSSHESADSDSEDVVEPIEFYSSANKESLKYLLYPNALDETISKLNRCSYPTEIFQFIDENREKINHEHVCQIILVMWSLQKIYPGTDTLVYDNDVLSDVKKTDSQQRYDMDIAKHPRFTKVLDLVLKHHRDFSPDEASCTLLYLCRMGVSIRNEVLQALVVHCERMMKELGDEFPLTALSRFTVASKTVRGLWLIYTARNTLNLVVNKLYRCSTAEDMKLIATCFNNIHDIVSMPVLESYIKKVKELLNEEVITSDHPKVILKIIYFLNFPHWITLDSALTKELMLKLKDKVANLEPRELVFLHKVFQHQLEPTGLLYEIQSTATKILSEGFKPSRSSTYVTSVADLLVCAVPFSSLSQRKFFEDLVKSNLHSPDCESSLPALFKVLRHLRTSDINLCDLFWSKTLRHLQNNPEEREDYMLLRMCHRYMHFNNNLGGTYRHYDFEGQMIQWLIEDIRTKPTGVIPSKFSRTAAFIIAYYKRVDKHDSLPDIIISKLKDMASQFSELDCLHISRGLRIATELHFRKQISFTLAEQLMEIDHVLNSCAYKQIQKKSSDIREVNMIMRAYTNRNGNKDADLFHMITERYKQMDPTLSSRVIKEATFNMQATDYVLTNTVDQITSYIVQNKDHVLGDTIEKILFVCYNLGYTLENTEEFLTAANENIMRNRERISGLSLIQASLALCYYHKLSSDLINYIFTVGFLERLDEEIRYCYSKALYPVRVRHLLMQLNRAVCLDYPQADVPWFHKKFCEQIIAQASRETSQFQEDVYRTLKSVVDEDKQVKVGIYSPYAYKIDFLLEADPKVNPEDQQKVAVMLMKNDAFCNDGRFMKGPYQLKKRHLEILGYHVITVSLHLWHSMFMSEPGAKVQFFRENMNCKQ